MDAGAVSICAGPDGKLYCIPMASRPSPVYVWADNSPGGHPRTIDQMLVEWERLKQEGKDGMTFFGFTGQSDVAAR